MRPLFLLGIKIVIRWSASAVSLGLPSASGYLLHSFETVSGIDLAILAGVKNPRHERSGSGCAVAYGIKLVTGWSGEQESPLFFRPCFRFGAKFWRPGGTGTSKIAHHGDHRVSQGNRQGAHCVFISWVKEELLFSVPASSWLMCGKDWGFDCGFSRI